MRLLVLGSCALFLCLPAWCQKDLQDDLLSLAHIAPAAAQKQIALHLTALSEKTHEPSRPSVETFARDLVSALRLRKIEYAQARQLASDIDAVLKSAGTSTLGFLDRVRDFESVLHSIGASAGTLGAELEVIGRQVRGPDDTPVMPARFPHR